MAKKSSGVPIYAVVACYDYYDGGDEILSLHRTKDGAKAAIKDKIATGKYTRYDLDIEKYELED